MNPQIAQAQDNIVRALAAAIREPWERIVVNYEIGESEGLEVEDRRGFYLARNADGALRKGQWDWSPPLRAAFRALREAMAAGGGDRWGTADLVVDPTGKYRFNFDYGPPRRINGVFDDTSMGRFDRYLEEYAANPAPL